MAKSIYCLTLNPCLDKTLTVPEWTPGQNVRGTAIREVVGGKGNNVARALKGLGQSAIPITFLGGATGRHCAELLREADGLLPVIIDSNAETRTILTVRTGESADQTAFFDPNPRISNEESERLINTISNLLENRQILALTLSGSSPCSSTDRIFGECVQLARLHQVPVLLDSYGSAICGLGRRVPNVLQMNQHELSGLMGKSVGTLSEEEILHWLADWSKNGLGIGVVTRGPDPALAVYDSEFFRIIPPDIKVVNPIGSGDCFLAGMTMGVINGLSAHEHLQFAAACAVTNALTWDAGSIEKESAATWVSKVKVESICRLNRE